MAKQSAGILVYRRKDEAWEVLLVHLGGPFWAKKDVWSIPKGETDEGEDLMSAARREFKEETGFDPPDGEYVDLGQSKQGSIKINYTWAVEGEIDISQFACASTFTTEWPPRSGKQQSFPENDRAAWFGLGEATKKLFKAQLVFIERLAEHLQINLTEENSGSSENATPQQSTLF